MKDYDLIAPFYDIEHAHFDEDLNLYMNFAELCGSPLLELACGSGRLLVPLAREGYELTGVDRTELAFDADMLLAEGSEATDLKRFTEAPVECLITSVEFLASDSQRRILVVGEAANIVVETSPENALVSINAE